MSEIAVRTDGVVHDFYRVFAASVGGAVVDRDGVVACLGVHPSPIVTNTTWRSDPATDPGEALRTIDAIYAAAGFKSTLLTSSRTDADLEAAAVASGRVPAEELPVMVANRHAEPSDWPAPTGTSVRRLDPVADLALFRTILIDGFFEGDPEGRELIEATFATSSPLAGSNVAVFIGGLDGRPASVAGAWLLGDDAAIGWVATLPDARRRGLGALVTARATEWAFEQGARIAALQASPSGRPVYERIGFATVGLDRIWERAVSSGR
jgi:GNAT superfamily N-acetyltransferase